MTDNAYQSPNTLTPPRRTRSLRWAFWSGITCLVAAVLCAVLAVALMALTFDNVAQSSDTASPEELASGIRRALIPAWGTVLFGLPGIVLVIVGLVVRRPVDE